jgi:hypothetical protein
LTNKQQNNKIRRKTMTTETHSEYASKGVAGTGLGLGIAGTALGLLNGGGLGLLGGLGGMSCGCNRPKLVTEEEYKAGLVIAAKDSEIATLKAEKDDEKKMVEVYTALNKQINEVNDKMLANRDRADDRLAAAVEKLNCKIDFNKNFQDGVNAQQLAYNGTNSATIACMKNQLDQLYGVTKLVIPNSSVCPGFQPLSA